MSNAHHPKNEMAGAQGDTAIIGTFPARRNTVRAETLARLLNGERLTGMDAVVGSSTTRLAAAIHMLRTKYEWQINDHDLDVGCKDGRVSEVAVYFMAPEIIEAAFNAGAGDFIKSVFDQRKARRKQAPKARREAERRNIARALARQRHNPWQGDFFQGGTHDMA